MNFSIFGHFQPIWSMEVYSSVNEQVNLVCSFSKGRPFSFLTEAIPGSTGDSWSFQFFFVYIRSLSKRLNQRVFPWWNGKHLKNAWVANQVPFPFSFHFQLLSQTKPSVLLDRIEFKLNENENNLNDNKLLKQQYNFLRPDLKQQERNGVPSSPVKHQVNGIKSGKLEALAAGTAQPKFILCSPDAIQLEWKHVGAFDFGFLLPLRPFCLSSIR